MTPRLNCRLKVNHPFREFFIGGVYKRPCQKGRTLVLLKDQSPSRFPLINFLSLPDCPAHSPPFLCTRLTFSAKTREGRSTAAGWAPPVVPSLGPCRETEMSSGRDSPLAHTGPHFIHRLQGQAKSRSLDPLSPSSRFQLLAQGRRMPTALRPSALCPA